MQDVIAAAAFSALAMMSIPIAAQQANTSEPIVVSSTQAERSWLEAASHELEEQLARIETRRLNARQGSGIVQILFNHNAEGKPENLTVYSHSGNPRISRKAMQAITRMEITQPLPQAFEGEQFLANFVFALNDRQARTLHERLDVMEQARLASIGRESTFLALK